MNSDRGKSYGARDFPVENFNSPPTMVVRSPLFENSPRRKLQVRPSGLRDPSVSSDGELPPGWKTAEEQQRILLSRKYLSPKSKNSAEACVTSSEDDCPRSWKGGKLSYNGVQFITAEPEHQPYVQEHIDSRARRLSEGNYSLRYADRSVASVRKSDSDIFRRGINKTSSRYSVQEDMAGRQARVEVSRNTPSFVGGSAGGESALGSSQEDSSEGESKRTRMESTANEVVAELRRSKIRVLEEVGDPDIEWKDETSRATGSGGIGRGRIVKVKESCSADVEDSCEHLVRESHGDVRRLRINDDQDDFIQKCRNWSVADSYANVDGNSAPWKTGRFGCDRGNEAQDSKAHRRASFESDVGGRRSLRWSKFSEPLTISEDRCFPELDVNYDSTTEHSSSDLDSRTDLRSPYSDDMPSSRHKDAGRRLSLSKDFRLNGKSPYDQLLEAKSRRKSFTDDRCILTQGSDVAISSQMASSVDCDTKARNATYDSASSVVVKDRGKDIIGASFKELKKKRKSLRKRRSESPTAAVACAASMIGDTVDAVRKVREDAAELAFKLAELHAHDAKALRSAAAVMRHHVDSLHSEVHSFQASYEKKDLVEFPWHSFLKEFLVTASLVTGVFSVHACINSLRKALGSLKQTASRREKLALAAVLLTVGFGTSVYHGMGQVRSVRRVRDKQLRVHLKCIMERTSLLANLAHKDPTSSSLETFTEVEEDRQSTVYSSK
ncbi:hypothetical protein R1sor_019931 [Riccia sorocarpa]|uniref:Uncharacterized protein n=1 Tax=Riccia sorocarpa TaxID=122646 RepID=A0ABD3IH84_9MARC